MAKLLTNREMELFNLALNIAGEYDRVCPRIGIEISANPSRIDLAHELARKLSFGIDEDDLAEICEERGGS